MDADLTSPPGLYRIRSLGEYLTPSADDAPEDSPVLLHAMERVARMGGRVVACSDSGGTLQFIANMPVNVGG